MSILDWFKVKLGLDWKEVWRTENWWKIKNIDRRYDNGYKYVIYYSSIKKRYKLKSESDMSRTTDEERFIEKRKSKKKAELMLNTVLPKLKYVGTQTKSFH